MARKPDYLARVRRQENVEGRRLRKVSGQISEMIKTWAQSHPDDMLDPAHLPELEAQLGHYERAITPWAHATTTRMAAEVAIKERRAWTEHASELSEGVKRTMKSAAVGPRYRALLRQQAAAIQQMPSDAVTRIQKIISEARANPERSSTYIEEIMRSGEVSKSYATMLARTMVSSTASALIEARARAANSPGYIWETMRDAAVRPSHRGMQGKMVRWDDPPTLDDYTAHAGRYANCRCWCRPVWPDLG